MNNLRKSASFEKERAIKLESHSRRNNLIFYGVPEEVNETSVKTEDAKKEGRDAKLVYDKLYINGQRYIP